MWTWEKKEPNLATRNNAHRKLLNLTQWHWMMNHKSSIEGFSELAFDCVYMCECVRVRDTVKGQNAGRPVQIHSYSLWGDWSDRYVFVCIIVPEVESINSAEKIPGISVKSKHTVTPFFPADSFIRHCYTGPLIPFSLPITASSQTLCTQDLRNAFKSVWMIRVWQSFVHMRDPSVPLG